MRQFRTALFMAAILTASVASAQVNLPSKNDLRSSINQAIGQGGSATGSGAGTDLLNSYKAQLNQGMPCTGGNTSGCANLPGASGNSTSGSGTGTGTTTGTTGTGTTGTGTTTGTTTTGLTRDKLLDAITKAVTKRVASLGSGTTTKDLVALVRYIKAMHQILALYDTPIGKKAITALLEKLAQTNTTPIMQQLQLMGDSERELAVLQEVRREVGSKALTGTIDDIRNGNTKLKRAMARLSGDLQGYYTNAGSQEEKDRIRKVMDMLNTHVRQDIPSQVLSATVSPFTAGGKTFDALSGKHIAKMLEQTDDSGLADGDAEEGDDELGADIVRTNREAAAAVGE